MTRGGLKVYVASPNKEAYLIDSPLRSIYIESIVHAGTSSVRHVSGPFGDRTSVAQQ
jgi:hypothetical protein